MNPSLSSMLAEGLYVGTGVLIIILIIVLVVIFLRR